MYSKSSAGFFCNGVAYSIDYKTDNADVILLSVEWIGEKRDCISAIQKREFSQEFDTSTVSAPKDAKLLGNFIAGFAYFHLCDTQYKNNFKFVSEYVAGLPLDKQLRLQSLLDEINKYMNAEVAVDSNATNLGTTKNDGQAQIAWDVISSVSCYQDDTLYYIKRMLKSFKAPLIVLTRDSLVYVLEKDETGDCRLYSSAVTGDTLTAASGYLKDKPGVKETVYNTVPTNRPVKTIQNEQDYITARQKEGFKRYTIPR